MDSPINRTNSSIVTAEELLSFKRNDYSQLPCNGVSASDFSVQDACIVVRAHGEFVDAHSILEVLY
jgi:hypothetical protein